MVKRIISAAHALWARISTAHFVFFFRLGFNRALLLGLAAGIFFALFPAQSAHALGPLAFLLFFGGSAVFAKFLGGDIPLLGAIGDGVLKALAAFFNIFLGTIAGILQGIYAGIGEILHEIIAYFLSLTVNPGAVNADGEFTTVEFVRNMWNFSVDFVSLFFLLILVFIGLATILRLQNYQLQRTLPLLLIVVLLVNFSGVFVGVIVDAGNILTNFFLEASKEVVWETSPWQGFAPSVEAVGQNIARIIYYNFGILIYFLFILIFGLRALVLWVLVILAPFAFAALALPLTRGIWNKWWGALIQWAFLGLPMAFFLYLAGSAFALNDSLNADFWQGTQTFGQLIAPMASLLLLYIGFMLTMQFSPGSIKIAGALGVMGGLAAGSAALRFRGAPGTRIPEQLPKWLGGGKIPKQLGGGLRLGFNKGIGETLQERGIDLRKIGQIAGLSQEKRKQQKDDTGKALENRRKERGDLMGEYKRIYNLLDDPSRQRTQEIKERLAQLTGKEDWKAGDEEGGVIGGLLKQQKRLSQPTGITTKAWSPLARWAGAGMELGAGELVMRTKAKDEREIAQGKAEGLNKDSRDNITKINQEFAKGMFANMNRVVGLLNAVVANTDSDDLQEYVREGLISGERLGEAVMVARRGGPPAYRPIMKALANKMWWNPDQFGKNFAGKREANGNIMRTADGAPMLTNEVAQGMVREVLEKLQIGEISQKILGDAIDKGKAGGWEFEHGGKDLLDSLLKTRGGDLTGALLRRPESKEGRAAMMDFYRGYEPEELYRHGAQGVLTYLASTAAQGAGITSPLEQRETRELIQALRNLDRGIELWSTRGVRQGQRNQDIVAELSRLWTVRAAAATPPPSTPPTSVAPGDVAREPGSQQGGGKEGSPRPGDAAR